MFWALILEPYRRYTQCVKESFHVSMASLDTLTADETPIQVMITYLERNFLLCTLKKNSTWQIPLDLNFQKGSTITFLCNGQGSVHLTGYLLPKQEEEEPDDLCYSSFSDAEEEEQEEEQEEEEQEKIQVGKRKAESPKEQKVKRSKQKSFSNEDSSQDDHFNLESFVSTEGLTSEDEDEDEEEENEEDESNDNDEEQQQKYEQEKQKKNHKREKKEKQRQEQRQQKKKKEDELNGKLSKQEIKQEMQSKQKKNKTEQQLHHKKNNQNEAKKIVEGGLQIEEIQSGNGVQKATQGKSVSVFYVGRCKVGKEEKIIDSCTQGNGFKFRIGKGQVIKGWDIGIIGMKIGGKRRLTIPSHMGYGTKGCPPTIPGNSTLIFDIELKNIH